MASVPLATIRVSGRKCPSWIESFLELTKGTQSPLIFCKWAAVAIVAGALERKVWLKVGKRILYPNLYILLTGGPGIGKTDALREVVRFWSHLPDLHIAPSSVSRASLSDSLNAATRSILRPVEGDFLKFNSLQVCAEEFGTFLAQYETEFMSTLNHLYDCVRYSEKKRSMKEPIDIPNPQLSIVAATTPAWLGTNLPDVAWAEGFSSRLIMIFSGERIKTDLFHVEEIDEATEANLVHDLQDIHALYGQFKFEPTVQETFMAWYYEDCPPRPDHPKLEHYLPRRHIHFLKLCIVFSAMRGSDLVIRIEDYQAAQDLLLEAESFMPDIFKSMKTGADNNTLDETFAFIWQTFAREKTPVAEHRILYFISQRAPSYSVAKILEVMLQTRMIEVAVVGSNGRNTYKPVPRASHSS